ncbi:MAG: tetratricopeptide repeat protein [Verrucomicrobia bacterium]|nr:tetratricopeptide repeat protein [Verrucomicrobiota bacterium]
MTAWNHRFATIAALAACLCTARPAAAQLTAQLTSRHLARGEQAFLEIILPGRPPDAMPVLPAVQDVAIRPTVPSAIPRQASGRRVEYFYQYVIESYALGRHTIPPVEVVINGTKSRTEPLEFVVFNPDELQWDELTVAGRTLRYAADFHLINKRPYEGETIPTEIKVFIPKDFATTVQDWGVPEFERDGVACWRFEPATMRGQLNVLGRPYVTLAYPSTLTPTRSGKVAIGPAKLRLTSTQIVVDGFLQRVIAETFLNISKLEFETSPLPPGAPAGFDNAIGSFTLRASSSETEVREGDPIAVDIIVTGSGNLDTLRPPRLEDPKGWKIYEATATQRGDERRRLSGSVIFQQLIKPLELQTSIPPFRLAYFEPTLKQYRTLTTAPVPLKILPATHSAAPPSGPPQALPLPIERMTDILTILRPAQLLLPARSAWPPWLWHVLAALLALGLLAKTLWRHLSPRLHKDPIKVAELRALKELSRTPADNDTLFLKNAGAFIERWLGSHPSPDLHPILTERDAVCFLAENPKTSLGKRRHEILRTLRKAITAGVMLAAALLPGLPRADAAEAPANQAIAAYDSANYDEAIKLWLAAGDYAQLSPAVLYNIGNACYRLGSPGHAALYYRRALARDPSHEESRQNLRFIERKCGALTVQRPEYQYALARLPLALWQSAAWAGAWLCTIALLIFPATRSGAPVRIGAIGALVAAPLLAAVGVLGWHYYPDDAEFAPFASQAVIIADKVVVHSDAARTSPEIIDAPPGSLCEIIRLSGDWAYIAFATKTRGWVPANTLDMVIPTAPPAPPKIRKPLANERTA